MSSENNKIRKKYILEIIIAAAILIFCEWFFFRNIIGTENLIGDRGDGRLTALLTEHWWRFFCGDEKFADINMFFPFDMDLGYTDMLLGYGLIYSVFRYFGMDVFASYKLMLMILQCIGVIAMYVLLRKKLNFSLIPSLFGTLAFSFSNSVVDHYSHTQLVAVNALPILLILLLGFIRGFENRKKRNIYAYLFLFSFILLAYTSWYVAFFTGLYCLVFAIAYLFKLWTSGETVIPTVKKWLLTIKWDMIGYIIFSAVLFIPFIYVYLPIFTASSGYDYVSVRAMMPRLWDFVNVPSSNLLLGKFQDSLGFSKLGELQEGFSLILFAVFFFGYIYVRANREKLSESSELSVNISGTAFISVLICMLLILRINSEGLSLWQLVNIILPFSKSVRAVARFMMWLTFPMAVVSAFFMNVIGEVLKSSVKHFNYYLSAVTLLLVVSNIDTIGCYSYWNRTDEMNFISSVQAPPENAECFYIMDSSEVKDANVIYQIDAFEIATFYDIPTFNGYSGSSPEGWDELWNVDDAGYESHANNWAESHGLQNVYAYDRSGNTWASLQKRIIANSDSCFDPSNGIMSFNWGLADDTPADFVWTTRNAEITIKDPEITDRIRLDVELPLSNYKKQSPETEPYFKVYVNDVYIRDLAASEGFTSYILPVEKAEDDIYTVRLETNSYFVPRDIRMNEDTRELSIALYYVGRAAK